MVKVPEPIGVERLHNSEILLIFEAKNCNPNGDPDAENRPRIDPKRNINYVSDVRLKRFFRDYLVEEFGEEYVYVTKVEGRSVRADERLKKLLGEVNEDNVHLLLKRCLDARLFGATVPLGKGDKAKGASISFIGPVQFTWGFSFHEVELIDFPTITSVFSGREEAGEYGTMGKDWRLYYSLLGFYGVVSGRRAEKTGMTFDDLKIFDDLLWVSLQVQPTTRSKIGEKPHLYLRFEYKDSDTILGDLRKYVKVKPKGSVRDLEDLEINFDALAHLLKNNSDRILKVYLRTSDEFSFVSEVIRKIGIETSPLPHGLSKEDIRGLLVRQ